MALDNADGSPAMARGRELCEQGQYEAAVQAFVEAATADPANVQARFWLGHAYEQMGQHHLALEQYQAGLQLAPWHAELRSATARMHAMLQVAQHAAVPQAASSGPNRRMLGIAIAAGVCFIGLVLLAVFMAISVNSFATATAGPEGDYMPEEPEWLEEYGEEPIEGEFNFDFEAAPIEESEPPATPEEELLYALSEMRGAVGEFRARYGCYPARLEDLVASSAPAYGLDEQGNSVSLRGEYQGPTLITPDGLLPVDAVLGGRSSWSYSTSPPDVGAVRSGSLGVAPDGTRYSDF